MSSSSIFPVTITVYLCSPLVLIRNLLLLRFVVEIIFLLIRETIFSLPCYRCYVPAQLWNCSPDLLWLSERGKPLVLLSLWMQIFISPFIFFKFNQNYERRMS